MTPRSTPPTYPSELVAHVPRLPQRFSAVESHIDRMKLRSGMLRQAPSLHYLTA